jgi:hypothetical protein
MREETAVAGLKTLRNSKDKKPRYHCENCGCDRFKPCQCSKKKVGKDGHKS